jgi:hypothetical protein
VAAASAVFQNNQNGTWTEVGAALGLNLPQTAIAGAVQGDFDNDLDLDLVLLPVSGKPLAWVNDRAGKFHLLDDTKTGLNVEGVISATLGDPNKDGKSDLLIFARDGLHLFLNQGGFRFAEDQDFRSRFGGLKGTGGQFADMSNRGQQDILIADAHRKDGSRGPVLLLNDGPGNSFLDAIEADPGNLLGAIKFKGNASCVVADFCGKGRCDILLAPSGEPPMLIQNMTQGGHWIELDLVGTRTPPTVPRARERTPNSPIGARVEIRTGSLYQQYLVGVPTGPVSVAPLRIHAGIGENTKVDWVRIYWPESVLQGEIDLAADQVHQVSEQNRKPSSCPHLFAWDGSHFQFVSDFGGKGGLGYLVAPGQYAPPDPREYLPLPHLEPLDGDYVLQVTEPLEEVVYLDEAKLMAVDHPADTEVYPQEMMAVNGPPPRFSLFCYRNTIEPARVVDHRGVDVTERVRRLDRRYAGATDLDPRFPGFARDHHLELDFGEGIKKVAPGTRLVLFLQGWVEYGYSSTNFAASQAGLRLRAPSIHAWRNGQWVELFHEVGYPAGINHTMTLDVTGKILATDQKIRISSNMDLYWDRVFLATTLPNQVLTLKEFAARSADLHFLGYPREYSPDGRQPNLLDYSNRDRNAGWKTMPGDYTRYGDVTPLVQDTDDCFVIMGPGEEVTLRFPAAAFGPVPKGYRRTFLLKTDSFCKDMNYHTAFPQTVGPLPFHGMSGYPYRAEEKYPDTEKTRAYREKYNRRQVR